MVDTIRFEGCNKRFPANSFDEAKKQWVGVNDFPGWHWLSTSGTIHNAHWPGKNMYCGWNVGQRNFSVECYLLMCDDCAKKKGYLW